MVSSHRELDERRTILAGKPRPVGGELHFSNGFHDAANSISCIVSTRVLSPTYALYGAAFSNFVDALIIGTSWSRPID
jgi:phosphate/sulfate permease